MSVALIGRPWTLPKRSARLMVGLAATLAASFAGVRATQDAIANGDTRTLTILHTHTNESATITFRRNGRYDGEALNQLNWMLRDWRLDKPTKMDPRLFDIVWEVYREVGAREPVHVLSAYRAPETNAMLRGRSKGVSEHSQHMLGKAMDFRLPDVDMGRVRAIAMRLQHGGVGYYPSSGFVHLDAGSVRAWPRMTQDQLARLFPDGKTVHLPASGKPFARYEEARADILSRGGSVGGSAAEEGAATGPRRSLWATLFGGGDEDADYYRNQQSGGRGLFASRNVTAYAPSQRDDDRAVSAVMPAPSPRSGRTQVAAAPPAAEAPKARFFWQRDPVEPPQAGPVQEPLQTAALGPATLAPAISAPGTLAPMPPRRPDDIMAAAFPVPMPPARPIELAAAFGAASANAVARPGPAQPAYAQPALARDDRAALRGLFAAAVTPSQPPAPAPASTSVPATTTAAPVAMARVRAQPIQEVSVVADLGPALNLGFSSAPTGDLITTAFTGPAVKPLPVLR